MDYHPWIAYVIETHENLYQYTELELLRRYLVIISYSAYGAPSWSPWHTAKDYIAEIEQVLGYSWCMNDWDKVTARKEEVRLRISELECIESGGVWDQNTCIICDEGAQRCIEPYTLQECQDNEWVTIEQNSKDCGYSVYFNFVEDGCYIRYGDDLFCFADETKDIPPGTAIWTYFRVKNTGEIAARATVKVFDGDTKLCEKTSPAAIPPGSHMNFYTHCFNMSDTNRDLVMKVYEYGKTEELDSLGC